VLTRLALERPTELRALADAQGKVLGAEEREHILREVRTGKGPTRITVTATVFRQTDEPNRNFIRFKRGMLRAFARSFVGLPLLRDHDKFDFLAQGGRVVSSEMSEAPDGVEFLQTLQLVKPWAIEAALDGTLDRFSIGWHSNEPPLCTVCKGPMFSLGCSHFPGDLVGEGDQAQHVELLYTAAVGVETSCVAVPAVLGTGIDEIRAALAAHRGEVRPHKEIPMKRYTVLAERLGVPEDAEEPVFLEAYEKRLADLDRERVLRTTEAAAHLAAKTRVAELEAQLAEVKRGEHAAVLSQLVDACRRKVGVKLGPDNKPLDGGTPQERVLLATAKHSLTEARAFVDELAQMLPLGQGTKDDPPTRAQEERLVTTQRRRLGQSLGLSDDDYAKYAPRTQPRVIPSPEEEI
jgi:hypothetical protein